MKGKQKSNYCIDTDAFYFITVLQQVSKNLFPNDRAAVIKKRKSTETSQKLSSFSKCAEFYNMQLHKHLNVQSLKKMSTFNQLTEKYERYPYSLSKCFLFQKKQLNNRKCKEQMNWCLWSTFKPRSPIHSPNPIHIQTCMLFHT